MPLCSRPFLVFAQDDYQEFAEVRGLIPSLRLWLKILVRCEVICGDEGWRILLIIPSGYIFNSKHAI